ncbi:MAG: VCBS domain-containing protein, partial [Desulfovibrio sp.]|uniref:VCBS domain-containing protein n=1 Tax=Desulfovibrio sp. TaxID=885 RepID=UPI0025C3B091
GLGVGEKLTDTFSFTVSDGHGGTASNSLTLTINGTNDAPVLVPTILGIAKDSAITSGTLSLPTDADVHDVVSFTPQTNAPGSYGTFTLSADGHYAYTLNTSLPVVQGLGSGESLTDAFTVTVSDGHGGTASAVVTMSISGSNQAPTVAAATAVILEDAVSVSGDLPVPTDPNIHDVLTFIAQSNVVGSYGKLTLDVAGHYTYTLNNALPVVQGLGVGEKLTDTFTFTVSDGHGGTVSNTLTLTINGTNDLPGVGAATASIIEDAVGVSGTLPVPVDPDLHDVVSFVPQTAALGLYGTLSIDAGGNYTYTLNNALPAVQGLGVGEKLTDTFTFTVSDNHGGTATNTLTLTINGTNDLPTVASAAASIIEDTAGISGKLPTPVDPDLHDVMSFVPQTAALGLYGTLTVDASGNYTYALNNALPVVQGLGVGEKLTDTFTFKVSDGHGGTASNTLTVTINGANDVPVLTAATAAIFEDAATVSGKLPAPVDPDLHDVVSFVPQTAALGLYGTLSIDAGGNYTYTLNNALPAVQGLGVGEKLTDTFTFKISDGHGGTASSTLTLTINGSNDVPTVAAAAAAIFEDTAGISGKLPTPVDADIHDTLAFIAQTNAAGLYGTLTLDANGNYTYTLNNALPAVQGLGVGEKLTDTFTFRVSDGHGGMASNTLTVTINGTNDIPTVAAATASIFEDAATVTGKLPTPVDADIHDTLTFTTQTNAAGLYGTLTLDASGNYTYKLNNGLPAVQGLGVGEKLTDSFTFVVSDGHGGTTANILTLTINGTNDAPSVGASTGIMVKTDATLSGRLVTPTDPDNDLDHIVSDTLTFTPKVNVPGSYGRLTLNADGTYVYTLNTGLLAVVGLLLNQKLTDTFTYTVTDGHGGTASNTLTITIKGGLGSLLSLDAVTTGLVDTASNVVGAVTAPLNAVGNVAYSLVDNAGLGLGVGLYGSLTLQANGTYNYQLNTGLSAVVALGVGEKLTETFTFTATDSLGKTATSTISIAINGTNDAPQVLPVALSIAEHGSSIVSGLLNITDPDSHDTPHCEPGSTTGSYGTLIVNANGSYSYVLDQHSSAVLGLGVGETLTESFPVTVVDGHGGSASTVIKITINGQNDAPTVAAANVDLSVTTVLSGSSGHGLEGILPTPHDPDIHDLPTYVPQHETHGLYGDLTLQADGSYVYTLHDNQTEVKNLGLGLSLQDVFTYTVDDGHGGTATNTLTLTIHGSDAAPAVMALASLGVDSAHGDSAPATVLSATVAPDTEALDHAVADNLLDGGSTHNSLFSADMATVAGDNAATSPSTQEGQSSPGHETGASPAAQPAAQDGGETEGFFHDQSSTYKEPILSEDAEDSLFPSGASSPTAQSLNAGSSAVQESGQAGAETPAAALGHESAAVHTAAAVAAPDTHGQAQQESPGTAQSAPAAPAETAVADASASASHADQLAALQHLVQNGQ